MPPRSSLLFPQDHDDSELEDFRNSDVIFGTRGNGGNATFLHRLEETADHYSHLSKYEKMECIKDIITNWHGRFFIISPDGNCSQVLEFEASPSSKLYTSVRRMMNYVIKKKSLNSNPGSKYRLPIAREKKRMRRIRVLGKEDLVKEEESPHAPESDHSMVMLKDHPIPDISRMEDAAIQTLVSLISSGRE
eukprot:scaffold5074_cov99-Cylindrotheca_fusiformis.AAC.5